MWYILDEFGSRFRHGDADATNVTFSPFFFHPTKTMFEVPLL
jgi:hypothetical protein